MSPGRSPRRTAARSSARGGRRSARFGDQPTYVDYKNDSGAGCVRSRRRIDVFFDNVGGRSSMPRWRTCAVVRGSSSTARSPPTTTSGSRVGRYMSLLVFRARMQGFLVFDYPDKDAAAIAELAEMLLPAVIAQGQSSRPGRGLRAHPPRTVRGHEHRQTGPEDRVTPPSVPLGGAASRRPTREPAPAPPSHILDGRGALAQSVRAVDS